MKANVKTVAFVFCPSEEIAMGIIVVALTCTAYLYSSFIMQ